MTVVVPSPEGLLTPNPVGPMPDGVKIWPDGPPYGRLELLITKPVSQMHNKGVIVIDDHSGERFWIRPAKCGLGCECASDAVWLPSPVTCEICGRIGQSLEEILHTDELCFK